MEKTLLRITLLILSLILLISCSAESESTAKPTTLPSNITAISPKPSLPAETETPTPIVTATMTPVPATPESTLNPTSTPIPTVAPTPSVTPDTSNQKISITHAALSKIVDGSTLEIDTAKTINYSGSVTLTIFFDGDINQDIKNYIYIDNSIIDPTRLQISPNLISVDLVDDMSEYFTFKINASEETETTGISEDYAIYFYHTPPLTCEISLASPLSSIFISPPILLSQLSHDFMISFNKPVKMDTLIFPDLMDEMDIAVTPMSDSNFILTVSNLSLTDHRIGIEYIEGESQSFNNELYYDRFTNQPLECIYRFGVSNPQNLCSIEPDTLESTVIHEFDFGTIFEDISPNAQYLSLGTVINDEDGYQYATSIIDINTGQISFLDTLISDSISAALDAEISIYTSSLYNPMIENEYWDNGNNYHYFFGNSIYDINPSDLSAEIRYSSYETSRFPYPVFHLDNGEIATIKRTGTTNQNYILVVTQRGEYDLPIRLKHGEGWIHYEAHVADIGNDKLLVSGYDFTEGEENLLSTYTLDLNDSSLSLLTKNKELVGFYKEPGYIIYSNYVSESEAHILSILTTDGQLLVNIAPEPETRFYDVIYDKNLNVFYIKQFNHNTKEYSIMILDAETFELTSTQISFGRDFYLIGITESGNLLIMDMP